ncbi:hypothetical protein VTN00DRAFT_6248 [Thermoascus crustaceus]|uniref:uncharacterized protein n=1 Tax=Thermoascus crustaceus TaxID=5088 RepID=UPI00374339D1
MVPVGEQDGSEVARSGEGWVERATVARRGHSTSQHLSRRGLHTVRLKPFSHRFSVEHGLLKPYIQPRWSVLLKLTYPLQKTYIYTWTLELLNHMRQSSLQFAKA